MGFKNFLLEYSGGIVFHGTTLDSAISILKDNKFNLSNNNAEYEDLAKKGNEEYDYFLSTSRTKEKSLSFIGKEYRQIDVVFNIDGRKLQSNLKSSPVQFHPFSRRKDERDDLQSGKYVSGVSTYYDENEQRYFSKKSKIDKASKYIDEVHVYLGMPMNETRGEFRKNIRRILYYSIINNIKIYLYTKFNKTSFNIQAKSKAESPSNENIQKIKKWKM